MPPPPLHSRRSSALLATVLLGVVAALLLSAGPEAAVQRDTSPPSAPTALLLVSATETTVTFAWHQATDNVGVDHYRARVGNLRERIIEKQVENRWEHTESGLSCGASYLVDVRAADSSHNVSLPAQAVVATAPCLDKKPPSPPSGLQQIARGPSTATLSWQPSSDNIAVAGYAIGRYDLELARTSETSYAFVGLECGRSHALAVRAYDVAGNNSAWVTFFVATSACGDLTPPSAPTGLLQRDRTRSSMSIAWSASTDNSGAVNYVVYRDGTQVTESSALTAGLAGLACDRAYAVGVEAADAAGNRSQRTTATMSTAPCGATPTPPGGDTRPPSPPTNVSIVSTSATSATLEWSPATDNIAVTGYGVFRDGVRVQVVPGTTFAFRGLACGETYQLGVEAYDAAGNRSPLRPATATTSPCSDPTPPSTPHNFVVLSKTSTSVTVSWTAAADNVGVAGYSAYVDGELTESTTDLTYTFTELGCNTSHIFSIDAYDATGNRSQRVSMWLATASCSDSQAPSAPSLLTVSSRAATSVTLGWSASSDNSRVAGYDVLANGAKVATVTGTSTAVGNLKCNTTYLLGVEAFDAVGNRSSRATISTSTTACDGLPLPSPPPPGGNLFVSPNGSDSNPCTQAAPCASLNRAYSLAQPGQTVAVAGGTYGNQVILYVPGRDSAARVTFVPQGQVSIQGNLEIHASGVHVAGQATGSMASWRARSFNITVSGQTAVAGESSSRYPRNVTIEGVDTANLGTFSSENVTVRDVDVGPAMLDWAGGCTRPENKIGRNGVAAPVEPKNVLWERVAIHDQNRTQTAANNDCHYGGLFLVNGQGITIRNSVFEQNVVYNIQVQNFGGNPPSDVTIENNWFGCPVENSYTLNGVNTCDRQPSIQFNAASTFSNWLIRYNSFVASIGQYVPGASYSNVRVVGNAGDQPSANVCGAAGITYTKNAWIGATCGSSDKSISNPFVSTVVGAEDLRLIPGAGAIDAGDPASFPAADFDGQARSSPPDAGADER